MEKKLKHLEMIQSVITRMANNSFLLKGWCVTLVAAIFALASKDANMRFLIIPLLPIIGFWYLDAYFLRQEKLYRKLYDHVRVLEENRIDFSMNTLPYVSNVKNCFLTMLSNTLFVFYATVSSAVIIIIFIAKLI